MHEWIKSQGKIPDKKMPSAVQNFRDNPTMNRRSSICKKNGSIIKFGVNCGDDDDDGGVLDLDSHDGIPTRKRRAETVHQSSHEEFFFRVQTLDMFKRSPPPGDLDLEKNYSVGPLSQEKEI